MGDLVEICLQMRGKFQDAEVANKKGLSSVPGFLTSGRNCAVVDASGATLQGSTSFGLGEIHLLKRRSLGLAR